MHNLTKDQLDVSSETISDFESIQIQMELSEIKNKPQHSKTLQNPIIGLKFNLYSFVSLNDQNDIQLLKYDELNNKEHRERPEITQKDTAISIKPPNIKVKSSFTGNLASFGMAWATEYKNDKNALPCLSELMDGLVSWHIL